MIDIWDFEDIRPYQDEEIPLAIERLIKEPLLYVMMEWVYPNLSKDDIAEMMIGIDSVAKFQENISGPAFKVVTQLTTSGLTFSHMDRLEKKVPYLFLSNHRDIILDSALLNVSLMEKGFKTTQIAIGNNLLQNPLIYDLIRINKNFIVHRNSNPKEMLMYSKRLSNYIRKTLIEDETSIWLAHKEGRSKDGDDRTASGLLKMLTLSNGDSVEDGLRQLNIVPMSVSYEYDPCDLIKVNELLNVKISGSHEKQPDEDFHSMIKGVTGHKGRVNIAIGHVLDKEYESVAHIENKNDKIKELAQQVDTYMHNLYKLWPTNYVAYDLLHGGRTYREHYTPVQKITFRNYIRGRVLKMVVARKKLGHEKSGFIKQVRELLLQMYANPVINLKEIEKTESLH